MKWALEIQFTTLDHDNLSDLLNSLKYTLTDADGILILTSSQLEQCKSVQEVFDCGKKLRSAFTGATQIDPKFEIGRILEYPGPKRHVIIELKSGHCKIEGKQLEVTVSPPIGLSNEELAEW